MPEITTGRVTACRLVSTSANRNSVNEKMNAKMTALVKSGTPKDKATAELKAYLKEIGWDNTVSTQTFLGRSLNPYYDEMAAAARR